MLSASELTVIKAKASSILVAWAVKAHQKELDGSAYSDSDLFEVMLYNFALYHYEYGSTLNSLTECQVQAIYSRLRELQDVA